LIRINFNWTACFLSGPCGNTGGFKVQTTTRTPSRGDVFYCDHIAPGS